MPLLVDPTLEDLVADAERDLRLRIGLYPRLVHRGSLSQENADWQIACQKQIVARLSGLVNLCRHYKVSDDHLMAAITEALQGKSDGR